MANVPYKGETPVKGIVRELVWQEHLRLLGEAIFHAIPHLALASRVAGDVQTLLDMGVRPTHVCMVEKDPKECEPLRARQALEGFRLFTFKIEIAVVTGIIAAGFKPEDLRSVYLDYCGNIQGTRSTTRRVVERLPAGSVLSITVFLGREHVCPEDREADLLQQVSSHTPHGVTLTQAILYTSSFAGSTQGTAMGTWTFFVGPLPPTEVARFDFR